MLNRYQSTLTAPVPCGPHLRQVPVGGCGAVMFRIQLFTRLAGGQYAEVEQLFATILVQPPRQEALHLLDGLQLLDVRVFEVLPRPPMVSLATSVRIPLLRNTWVRSSSSNFSAQSSASARTALMACARVFIGGEGEIRTHEGREALPVFKGRHLHSSSTHAHGRTVMKNPCNTGVFVRRSARTFNCRHYRISSET